MVGAGAAIFNDCIFEIYEATKIGVYRQSSLLLLHLLQCGHDVLFLACCPWWLRYGHPWLEYVWETLDLWHQKHFHHYCSIEEAIKLQEWTMSQVLFSFTSHFCVRWKRIVYCNVTGVTVQSIAGKRIDPMCVFIQTNCPRITSKTCNTYMILCFIRFKQCVWAERSYALDR